jgi:hypothetical protein
MSQIVHPPPTPVEDMPVYWFARLDRAVEEGDHPAAALAQRQLERLGVTVRYRGRQLLRGYRPNRP